MATQALSVFQFHTHSLRVFATDDGLSFVAVAKDVADVLGYATAKDFLRQVPESHKGRQKVPTPSGEQEMLVVDEAGLYRGVLRSNKPEAKTFQDWVFNEVLPAIRKTGRYEVAQPAQPPTEYLTVNDQGNIQRLIWSLAHHLRYESGMSSAM